jgi:catechol 2,3-dioxygenase-like lactoylglutathione lyase family enzyme
MIEALDYLTLPASARGEYDTLLGRRAIDGRVRTLNVGLAFDGTAPGIASMTFATADANATEKLLARRAVAAKRNGDTLALDGNGVAIGIASPRAEAPSPIVRDEAATVSALDHVVVRTPNPERAIAFYAGRLGLDLRLDRSNPNWGQRLLFFRCGDLVVEIAHDLKKGVSDGPDHLWGLSWRVPDIAKANARLKAAGLDVDALRDGRRPSTQVFTVKSGTAGVPTLFIGGIGRW